MRKRGDLTEKGGRSREREPNIQRLKEQRKQGMASHVEIGFDGKVKRDEAGGGLEPQDNNF